MNGSQPLCGRVSASLGLVSIALAGDVAPPGSPIGDPGMC